MWRLNVYITVDLPYKKPLQKKKNKLHNVKPAVLWWRIWERARGTPYQVFLTKETAAKETANSTHSSRCSQEEKGVDFTRNTRFLEVTARQLT